MPEAPELEVAREYLSRRAVGASVVLAEVLKPSVLRPLAGDLSSDAVGRTIESVWCHGKILLITFSGDRLLAINPMLTGALQYCGPGERLFKRTCIVLSLSNDREVRYLDDRQMGRVHYVCEGQLSKVPQLDAQGPDVLKGISFQEFQQRLSRLRGEIKGILTRGRVISGIGNAYADEVLFAAKVYPYRRLRDLLARIHRRTPMDGVRKAEGG